MSSGSLTGPAWTLFDCEEPWSSELTLAKGCTVPVEVPMRLRWSAGKRSD